MSTFAGTYPEQEAVLAWLHRVGVSCSDNERRELIDSVTEFRLALQAERDTLKAEVERLRGEELGAQAEARLICTIQQAQGAESAALEALAESQERVERLQQENSDLREIIKDH